MFPTVSVPSEVPKPHVEPGIRKDESGTLMRQISYPIETGAEKSVLNEYNGPGSVGRWGLTAVRDTVELEDEAVVGGDVVDFDGVAPRFDDFNLEK